MSTEENKAIVRKYREAHNQNKLDALDAIVAQDLIQQSSLIWRRRALAINVNSAG